MLTNRPGSEGIANGIVSQLLPEGCSKKRFRRLLISVFRLLDLEIGPADWGKGESRSREAIFRDTGASQPQMNAGQSLKRQF